MKKFWLTTSQAAERMHVSEAQLRYWHANGMFMPDHITPGGHRRYLITTVDNFLKGGHFDHPKARVQTFDLGGEILRKLLTNGVVFETDTHRVEVLEGLPKDAEVVSVVPDEDGTGVRLYVLSDGFDPTSEASQGEFVFRSTDKTVATAPPKPEWPRVGRHEPIKRIRTVLVQLKAGKCGLSVGLPFTDAAFDACPEEWCRIVADEFGNRIRENFKRQPAKLESALEASTVEVLTLCERQTLGHGAAACDRTEDGLVSAVVRLVFDHLDEFRKQETGGPGYLDVTTLQDTRRRYRKTEGGGA